MAVPEKPVGPPDPVRLLVRQVVRSLPALAAGVVVAVLIGWSVLGWSSRLLLPVGVVVVAWVVGEVVRLVLELDGPRR